MNEKIKVYLDICSTEYYRGTPIISDAQFDALAEYYGYLKVGSVEDGNAVKHYHRLYSLQKYYEDEGTINPLGDMRDISYSPKLDGAAISILYFKGMLVRVLTRGDGIEGKDITDKFIGTNIIPRTLTINSEYLQVTGEIVAPIHVENSRNYAAGSLNLKSLEEFKTRAISFFAYDCYPHITETYEEDMYCLGLQGFNTVKDVDIDKIYPTDGIVYRVNQHSISEGMGFTAHHPRFAYARKERQETVETSIIDVVWSTGRTGRVTPVAILSPVKIGDKEVSRATLHNPGFIESLNICIGDIVAIRLAGMIIPEVVHKVNA